MLGITEGDRWRPGIGDPTLMGWLTVAAYGFAALLCIREAWQEWDRSRAIFWGFVAGIMLLLGVNKQLDLQTWFTQTGRKIALAQGWYDERRFVQFIFVAVITLCGLFGFGAIWRLVHEHGSDLWLPLAGLFVVICFVVVRAASFHHIDQILSFRWKGFKMNWLFELSGIIIIIAGAGKNRLRLREEEDAGLPEHP